MVMESKTESKDTNKFNCKVSKNNKLASGVLVLALALALAGCGADIKAGAQNQSTETVTEQSKAAEDVTEAITDVVIEQLDTSEVIVDEVNGFEDDADLESVFVTGKVVSLYEENEADVYGIEDESNGIVTLYYVYDEGDTEFDAEVGLGDKVTVETNGISTRSLPAQAHGVRSFELLEKAEVEETLVETEVDIELDETENADEEVLEETESNEQVATPETIPE